MSELQETKYSGSEWLGYVPTSWRIGNIGSLYSLRNTKVSDRDYLPLSVTMKGIVPQLETAAKTDDHDSRKLVREGDFVINSRSDRRGSCGISAYDGSVSLINTVLTPRGNMIPKYYNWLFHTVQFADEFYKNGHGIVDDLWTTRWDEMKRILIPVPSESEQTLIASYLDIKVEKIDAIIAEAKASIKEYQQWKSSIIYEAITKGLDSDAEMADSGVKWIGMKPREWSVAKLKNYIDILPGFAFPSEGFQSEGIPLLRGINVTPNGIRWDDVVYWNEADTTYLKSFALEVGDVVMGLDRPWISVGTRIATIQEQDVPSYLLQRVCRIRVIDDKADIRFVKYWLASDSFMKSLTTETTGISVPHISTNQIQNFVVTMPTLKTQTIICDYLDSICERIEALITEKDSLIADLEAYKKSLIFEVVTGKRKVV